MDMKDILAAMNSEEKETKTSASKRPIGSIKLQVGGITLMSRSIWKESTSETPFLNELNELAKTDPAKAKEVMMLLLSKATVEVSAQGSSDLSLADLLK